MATAGYSSTPLIKKLGIIPSMNVLLVHAPADYMELLGIDISSQYRPGITPDLVHLFAKDFAVFEKGIHKVIPLLGKNPAMMIWVSWYKKSAGIPTDITEDVIRNYALQQGLVDIKVCAVSEVWSGLKLVVPLARRAALKQQPGEN